MPEFSSGSFFAGHRIEGVAGRGGMGVVYRATHLRLDRAVALKVISPDLQRAPSFGARFERESRLAASIDHPHVITIHDAGEEDGLLYISMRYVEGDDLAQVLAREGRLEPELATRLVAQVAEGLDAAHERGLVHRDVKPANILIEYGRSGAHAYLSDFGLTKHRQSKSAHTETGAVVGTIDYMAPEQVEGNKLDARTDVYALGCVLFQSLTGRVPFDKEGDVAMMFAHVQEPPPLVSEAIPGLPSELDDVVRRALAKRPEDRYLSAGDLGRAALSAAEGKALTRAERNVARGAAAPADVDAVPARTKAGSAPGSEPGPTKQAAAPRRRGRRRGVIFAAAAAGIIAVAGLVLAIALGGGEDGEGGEGRGEEKARIEDAITRFASSGAPSKCDKLATAKFLEQTWFTRDARRAREYCRVSAPAIDPPASIRFADVEARGARATVTFTPRGGPNDGTTQTVRLVERGGRWKLDAIADVRVDNRAMFDAARLESLQTPPGNLSKESAECLIRERRATVTDGAYERAIETANDAVFARARSACGLEPLD